MGDFSIVSFLSVADHMRPLRQPSTPLERKLAGRLMKVAAVVHQVGAGKGAYSARPKSTVTDRYLTRSITHNRFAGF